MTEFNIKKKLRFVDGLTLGDYHYWDEVEDDNIKRFHFMTGSDGEDHHIDFSPYYTPTEKDLEALREIVRLTGYVPDATDNGSHNFSKAYYPNEELFIGKTDMQVLLDKVILDMPENRILGVGL